jgi:hypothetical protein
MGYPTITASQDARISTATIPERLNLEQNPVENTGKVLKVAERQAPEEQLDVDPTKPTTKKSLSFKLAFIGLAASLFVFQVDATCLGIALPVSYIPSPFVCHSPYRY